ncbi:putative signal peptide protein [Puccinia sorghi]|uniref:Putative signal peptide protein n=1 Tax=Puccinia sorghi TaxID=27349 RepID=A0A0L6UEM8_9BASI|nr:putative signal peptide protein [Puccinia sorghi]
MMTIIQLLIIGVWLKALLPKIWNIQIHASNHLIDNQELKEQLVMSDEEFGEKVSTQHLIDNKGLDDKVKKFACFSPVTGSVGFILPAHLHTGLLCEFSLILNSISVSLSFPFIISCHFCLNILSLYILNLKLNITNQKSTLSTQPSNPQTSDQSSSPFLPGEIHTKTLLSSVNLFMIQHWLLSTLSSFDCLFSNIFLLSVCWLLFQESILKITDSLVAALVQIFFINFFGKKKLMIIIFLPTILRVNNLMVKFIFPQKKIFQHFCYSAWLSDRIAMNLGHFNFFSPHSQWRLITLNQKYIKPFFLNYHELSVNTGRGGSHLTKSCVPHNILNFLNFCFLEYSINVMEFLEENEDIIGSLHSTIYLLLKPRFTKPKCSVLKFGQREINRNRLQVLFLAFVAVGPSCCCSSFLESIEGGCCHIFIGVAMSVFKMKKVI